MCFMQFNYVFRGDYCYRDTLFLIAKRLPPLDMNCLSPWLLAKERFHQSYGLFLNQASDSAAAFAADSFANASRCLMFMFVAA